MSRRLFTDDVIATDRARLAKGRQPDGGWTVDLTSYSPAAALAGRGYTTVAAIVTLRPGGPGSGPDAERTMHEGRHRRAGTVVGDPGPDRPGRSRPPSSAFDQRRRDPVATSLLPASPSPGPVTGVGDPRRLAAVAAAELQGHAGDRDLDAVVATLQLACHVPIAVVNLVRPGLQTYAAEVGVGAPCTNVPDTLSFCAEVVDSGAALTVADAGSHPVYADNPLVVEGVVGAYAGAPLVDDGAVLGSVAMFDSATREFTARDLELLTHQAQLASTVLALRRASRTDALTGLPNRTMFDDRLAQAIARLDRHDALVAVMFVDLDGFKLLNDTRGHAVGDRVLAAVARRFAGALRPSDTLARVGGDEFVAVCEGLTRPEDADQVADRLIASVADGLELDGDHVPVGVSVGIAVTGDAGVDIGALMRAADQAMYHAKRRPGSTSAREPGLLPAGPPST